MRAAFMLSVLMLLACAGADDPPDLRYEAAQAIAEHLVPALHADLVVQAETLHDEVQALCAQPDAAGVDDARAAYAAARVPFMQGEFLNFGPVVSYPERFGAKLDSWPTDVEGLQQLVDMAAAFDQAGFDGRGAKLRGFHAIEHMLWAQRDADTTSEWLTAEPGRCALLPGLSADLIALSMRLQQTWQSDWAAVDAPRDAMHDMPQEMLDEWVNRMVFTVENIRAEKLGKPLGDSSGGEPLPDTLESRQSRRSLRDARDALDGVRMLFEGPGMPHASLRDALRDGGLAERTDQAFADAAAALRAIPAPLETAIVDARADVEAAQEALRALQLVLQVEVSQELGVTISFNDNDGD